MAGYDFSISVILRRAPARRYFDVANAVVAVPRLAGLRVVVTATHIAARALVENEVRRQGTGTGKTEEMADFDGSPALGETGHGIYRSNTEVR